MLLRRIPPKFGALLAQVFMSKPVNDQIVFLIFIRSLTHHWYDLGLRVKADLP